MKWDNLPEMLVKYGIRPNIRHLHQYFLIDGDALSVVVDMAKIDCRDIVMEIGAGVGNFTELLAQQAKKVVAYEIDSRYSVFLDPLRTVCNNLTIYFRDIRKVKWPEFDRLIANVPFNTLEPILPKLIQARFRNAILIVGDRFRQSVIEPLSPEHITKLAVMMHAFFLIDECLIIEKNKFYPEPNTDAIVVELRPAKPHTRFLQFCRRLFENQNKLVSHVAASQEIFCGKQRSRKHKVDLPTEIANKRVDRLSNSDFRKLFTYFVQQSI